MKYQLGQTVRFVGRPSEIGKHHPEYAQLLGQVGTVMEADEVGYEVRFEGFEWSGEAFGSEVPRDWFTCWENELEFVG